jgi:hypothetical protein
VATRIKHVEQISGKGRLTVGENVYPVGYVIDVYQKYADSTPLMRVIKGHLTRLNVVEFVRAMSPLKPMDLELQDARHAQIILKNWAETSI